MDAGDLVMCVDFSSDGPDLDNDPLFEGRVYRVSRAGYCPCCGDLCLGVEGNPWDAAYYARRFRPLSEGNDDAEIIERIKSCQPQKVGEPA